MKCIVSESARCRRGKGKKDGNWIKSLGSRPKRFLLAFFFFPFLKHTSAASLTCWALQVCPGPCLQAVPHLAFREFQACRSIAELLLEGWGWGIVLAWEFKFIQHLSMSQVIQAVLA